MPKTLLSVALITLIGFLLRLSGLEFKSLWGDELCSLATTLGQSIDPTVNPLVVQLQPISVSQYLNLLLPPLTQLDPDRIINILSNNIHPPLFFILLQPFALAGKLTTLAQNATDAENLSLLLRLLPILLSTLCIPTLYCLGKSLALAESRERGKHAGEQVGLFAALCFACSGYQVAHAQDARPYALTLLLAITSGLLTWQLIQHNPRSTLHWLGWILCGLLGIYTQYFYIFTLGFQVLALAFWPGEHLGKRRLCLGVSLMLIAIGFFPWVSTFKHQLSFIHTEGHYTDGLWKPLQLPDLVFRALSDFLFPQQLWGKIFVGFLGILGAGMLFLRRHLFQARYSGVLYASLWLITLFITQVGLDLFKDSHTLAIRRYTLLASIPLYLLVGLLMHTLTEVIGKRRVSFLAAMLFLALLGSSFLVISAKAMRSDDFRQTAQYLSSQKHLEQRDILLIHKAGSVSVGLAYYLPRSLHIITLPESITENNLKTVLTAIRPYTKVWIAYSHSNRSSQKQIRKSLNQELWKEREHYRFPGVLLEKYEHW